MAEQLNLTQREVLQRMAGGESIWTHIFRGKFYADAGRMAISERTLLTLSSKGLIATKDAVGAAVKEFTITDAGREVAEELRQVAEEWVE